MSWSFYQSFCQASLPSQLFKAAYPHLLNLHLLIYIKAQVLDCEHWSSITLCEGREGKLIHRSTNGLGKQVDIKQSKGGEIANDDDVVKRLLPGRRGPCPMSMHGPKIIFIQGFTIWAKCFSAFWGNLFQTAYDSTIMQYDGKMKEYDRVWELDCWLHFLSPYLF